MRPKEVIYTQMTDSRIAEFARKYRFPGWYIDSNGCYGVMIGRYWICIFICEYDDKMEVTVDTVGESGFFDNNLQWETPEDEEAVAETARRFVAHYANKIGG
mgnify:CR=1 FL=1